MRENAITTREALPGVYHLRDALDARMTLLLGARRALLWDAFDGCTDLTIRTPKGSYASRYAAAHGFGCVAE